MSEKKAENWITDSLTGSASGTGYEKEEWINELFSSTTQEEIRDILQNRLDGKFDFWNGSLQQNKPALWKEQYLLLSLFNGHYHLMQIPVLKNSFDWQVFRHYPEETTDFLQEKSIYAHVKWISENEIKVMYCIEDGGRGDEDGYGVEPDTWIVSALDKKGQFKYPFRLTR